MTSNDTGTPADAAAGAAPYGLPHPNDTVSDYVAILTVINHLRAGTGPGPGIEYGYWCALGRLSMYRQRIQALRDIADTLDTARVALQTGPGHAADLHVELSDSIADELRHQSWVYGHIAEELLCLTQEGKTPPDGGDLMPTEATVTPHRGEGTPRPDLSLADMRRAFLPMLIGTTIDAVRRAEAHEREYERRFPDGDTSSEGEAIAYDLEQQFAGGRIERLIVDFGDAAVLALASGLLRRPAD